MGEATFAAGECSLIEQICNDIAVICFTGLLVCVSVFVAWSVGKLVGWV
jgi:hypothetical protein